MSSSYYYVDVEPDRPRPPRWWIRYVIGSLCVVLGLLIPCGGILGLFVWQLPPSGPTLRPPGTIKVTVDQPTLMVVWVEEPDTSVSSANARVPSNAQFAVIGPDFNMVPVRKPTGNHSDSTLNTERTGVCMFDAKAIGTYSVTVAGSFSKSQTVVVTPDRSQSNTTLGIGGLALALIGGLLVLGGMAMLTITIVKHVKHRREFTTPA